MSGWTSSIVAPFIVPATFHPPAGSVLSYKDFSLRGLRITFNTTKVVEVDTSGFRNVYAVLTNAINAGKNKPRRKVPTVGTVPMPIFGAQEVVIRPVHEMDYFLQHSATPKSGLLCFSLEWDGGFVSSKNCVTATITTSQQSATGTTEAKNTTTVVVEGTTTLAPRPQTPDFTCEVMSTADLSTIPTGELADDLRLYTYCLRDWRSPNLLKVWSPLTTFAKGIYRDDDDTDPDKLIGVQLEHGVDDYFIFMKFDESVDAQEAKMIHIECILVPESKLSRVSELAAAMQLSTANFAQCVQEPTTAHNEPMTFETRKVFSYLDGTTQQIKIGPIKLADPTTSTRRALRQGKYEAGESQVGRHESSGSEGGSYQVGRSSSSGSSGRLEGGRDPNSMGGALAITAKEPKSSTIVEANGEISHTDDTPSEFWSFWPSWPSLESAPTLESVSSAYMLESSSSLNPRRLEPGRMVWRFSMDQGAFVDLEGNEWSSNRSPLRSWHVILKTVIPDVPATAVSNTNTQPISPQNINDFQVNAQQGTTLYAARNAPNTNSETPEGPLGFPSLFVFILFSVGFLVFLIIAGYAMYRLFIKRDADNHTMAGNGMVGFAMRKGPGANLTNDVAMNQRTSNVSMSKSNRSRIVDLDGPPAAIPSSSDFTMFGTSPNSRPVSGGWVDNDEEDRERKGSIFSKMKNKAGDRYSRKTGEASPAPKSRLSHNNSTPGKFGRAFETDDIDIDDFFDEYSKPVSGGAHGSKTSKNAGTRSAPSSGKKIEPQKSTPMPAGFEKECREVDNVLKENEGKSPAEKTKLIRQMSMKWHPDKAGGVKEVFQYVQQRKAGFVDG